MLFRFQLKKEKSSDEGKQKIFLQDELQRYQRLYEEMDDKYKNMLLVNAQKETLMAIPDKLRQQYTVAINYKKNALLNPDSGVLKADYIPKTLRTVTFEDVKLIGYELN